MATPALSLIDPSQYEPESRHLATINAENEQAALLFLVKIKGNIKSLEAEKESKCGPVLVALDAARQPYLKAIKAFESLKKTVEDGLSGYRRSVQIAAEAEQRRLLEEHTKRQREADEKARKEREALEVAQREQERLQAEADKELDEAQRRQVEADLAKANKAVEKAEVKVDKAEAATQAVAPPVVVEQVAKTVTALDGSKTTFRTEKYLAAWENGQPPDVEFHRDDNRFKGLGLHDRYWVVDLKLVREDVKRGIVVRGVVVGEKAVTSTRQGKP